MTFKTYLWIACPFLLAGLVVLGSVAWRTHRAKDSVGWPHVKGQITSATVDELSAIDGAVRYRPQVEYTYEVGGSLHAGTRLTFAGPDTPDAALAHALIAPFTETPEVLVYFNPNDPADAVLRPGDRTGLKRNISFGVFLLGLGLFAIGRGALRVRRRAR